MKRFLIGICLLTPLSVSAANKMSMVTYFPVPYVAYSRINVSDQLDAGLTSACNMNLGCNESSVNLQVNTLNVKPYSKLDLNGGKGVWSNSMTLGSGSDNGRIAFNKVRIQGGTSRSINVKGTMNVPSLKLFESDFPDCKQAGGKDGTMSWTPLKLKGASGSELYLACGDVEAPAANCSDHTYKLAHKSECCPSTSKTDTECWRKVTTSEEWTLGGETMIRNKPCTVYFNVNGSPTYTDSSSITSFCASHYVKQKSPISGISDLDYTLLVGIKGGGCPIIQQGSLTCHSENDARATNASMTWGSAGHSISCSMEGSSVCKCTYNVWGGRPCIKSREAGTSYVANGW